MHGLGFSSLVPVSCLLLPVLIALVIRRKWRRSVARKEEIKRLMILAAEEDARAELEASISYSAPTVSATTVTATVSVPKSSYHCVVCFCPTTTRCARCKAVRYCSGKCQIIHWRQGHKEECRPPTISYNPNDDGRQSGSNVIENGQHDSSNDRYENAPTGTSGVPSAKGDDATVSSVADSEETNSVSGSSGNSFSGFSSSAGGGESSDSVSVSESISSIELDGSDAQISADIGGGTLDSTLDKVDQTTLVSPKFATLVDSVGNFDRISNLNQTNQSTQAWKNQNASFKYPAQMNSVSETSVTDPGRKVSSGFWGRVLESVMPDSDALDDSALPNSNDAGKSNLLDAEKFNQSREVAPSSYSQNSETKGIKVDTGLSDASGIGSRVEKATLSENSCANPKKIRSSLSSGRKKSNHFDGEFGGDSDVLESSKLKAASSFAFVAFPFSEAGKERLAPCVKVSTSPSLIPGRLNLVDDGSISSSKVPDLRLSPTASPQRRLVTKANPQLVPNVKEKANNVETIAVASSQMSSPASSIGGLKSSVRKVVDQLTGPKSKRYSDKVLFSYDLFVKLYTSNKLEMQPCGLINCGNSCYANSVLQCLAFTPPLTAYFVQGLHSKACISEEWCFTCEFEKIILKAKEGKSPLSPLGIISQLQKIGSQFGHGREEDAHEFLRYAIDTMQSVCLKEAGVNTSSSFEEETSLIGLTFGGYLRSKIKCTKCGYKSEKQERMMDLTVEIEGDVEKLEDALRRFTSTEILDGDSKYQCSRCKSYEKAKKKLTILEAPNVLTIALKRFQSGKFGKINKSIRFPEILNLAPYMSGTRDKSPIYRLYGVVVHLDVMNAAFSGHYVCYVKNSQNKWFKIDDSMVIPAELEKILSQGAYMLLYARCSPRAPRRIISLGPKNRSSTSNSNTKSTVSNLRTTVTPSSVVRTNRTPEDTLSTVESFYLKFHRLQRILEEDASSDNYSFTSSNSDEVSVSTESTIDSTSTEDLADYIFGVPNRSWRSTSDSSASSSSTSPLYSRRSLSSSSETSRYQTDCADSTIEDDDLWDRPPSGSHRSGGDHFLHPDMNIHSRKLASSSCSGTNPAKVGWVNSSSYVKSSVSFRRSMSERTD